MDSCKFLFIAAIACGFTLHASAEVLTLNNGRVTVGADLESGGAITLLRFEEDPRNLINNFDRGRQVQQSYYAGQDLDRRDEGQSPNWSPWPWNPIQVGDAYGNSSEVLEHRNENGEIYTKTHPLLWDMRNEFGECHFETWITLDSQSMHVRNKLTSFRTDDKWDVVLRDQELPAVYTIGDLHTLYAYLDDEPWTKGALEVIPPVTGGGFPWNRFETSEHWAANVDEDTGVAVGVYNPTATHWLGGYVGSPGGGTNDGPTGFISPLRKEALDKDTIFEYEYWLVVGTLKQVRAFVYNKEGHPDFDGDGLTYDEETDDLLPDEPGIQNPFDSGEADTTGNDGADAGDGTRDGANDYDGDGLSNEDEFHAHKTNPLLPDTDGDGYDDAAEVDAETDPLDPEDFPRRAYGGRERGPGDRPGGTARRGAVL